MPSNRTVEEVISLASQIPVELRRRDNVSIVTLVKESNYRTYQSSIGIEDICCHLRGYSDLIAAWSMYSEDKRTSSGWYFDHDARTVGYFNGSSRERVETFDDVSKACASFIKHELDSIIDHLK